MKQRRSATRAGHKATIGLAIALGLIAAACADGEVSDEVTATSAATAASTTTAATTSQATSSHASETAAPTCPGFESDWSQSGRDLSYTSNNDSETAISIESVATLAEVWRHTDNGGVTGTPVIVDGLVFYGDWNGVVHAADACTGELMWSTSVSDRPVGTSLAVEDGLVVASDFADGIHALSQADGAIVWSTSLVGEGTAAGYGPPAIADGLVITGVAGGVEPVGWRGSIVGFDLATGEEVWRVYTDNDLPSEGGSVAVWSSPAVDLDRGVAYIGTGNSNEIRNDGEEVPDSPFANALIAIDIRSGEMIWVTRMLEDDAGRDFDIGAPPTLLTSNGRDLVAVGGKSGEFFALDRDSGEEVWRVSLTAGSRAGGVMKAAAYADDVLYVASNAGFLSSGRVFAIDAGDGTELWAFPGDAPLIGHNLSIANSVVFATWYNGEITALDANTGVELWSESLADPLQGGVSISDGYIFVGFGGGEPPDLLPTSEGGIVAFAVPSN
jgi:polyvinyl alcohol dehydrogenase (cytochrome)